jgi:hypothetical protein
MFLVVRADGKFWDGLGWSIKGKPFCTAAGATRSLHEEGESIDETSILPIELIKVTKQDDTTTELSLRHSETG